MLAFPTIPIGNREGHFAATRATSVSAFVARLSFMPYDGSRISSLILVVIAHIASFYLLALSPARETISKASAFIVTLIQEQPRTEEKPTALSKPRPVKMQWIAAGLVSDPLIAISNAPADLTATAPVRTQPLPTMLAMPIPLVAVVSPRFDADYLDNPAPAYPVLSRRLGEEGKVVLRVFVDAIGVANQLEISTSSGSQRLDTAAIEAVRRWKFIPAKQGDKFLSAWVLVPINFSLRG